MANSTVISEFLIPGLQHELIKPITFNPFCHVNFCECQMSSVIRFSNTMTFCIMHFRKFSQVHVEWGKLNLLRFLQFARNNNITSTINDGIS